MRCPYCNHPDSKVIDSREADEGIRRRRECLQCGLRFSTFERVQTTVLQVRKRDGRLEDFNRDKLTGSIRVACAKRPLPTGAIEKLVDEVEGELQKLGRAEVPTSLIGQMVMERLQRLDRVAYIRFASVYRDFTDVESFRREVDALLEGRELERQPGTQQALIPGVTRAPARGRRGRRPARPAALPMDMREGGGP